MPTKLNLQLSDILLKRKLLTQAQVAQVERATKKAGGQAFETEVIAQGLLTRDEVMQAKAELFSMPFIDLTDRTLPREVVKLIPLELAQNYQMVAYARNGKEVSLALVNPGNYKAIEAAEFMARENGWKPSYHVTSPEGLEAVLKQYASLTSEVSQALAQAEDKFQAEQPEVEVKDDKDDSKLEEVLKSAPVAKMVSVILRHAVEGAASDVHIEPVMDETRVRFRIDGILHTSIVLPRYIHSALISRIKVLANLKIDETRLPQDGRIRLQFAGKNIDFRVSTMPLLESEKVVMRILDSSSGVLSFEELGFWGRTYEVIKDNLKKSHGMFLVTGPTGSGKSTTLYTALNQLNQEAVNIITLEDPVEYYLKGVNQSQINDAVGLTFASGLRSILRQDPDVIMVGEIRDTETAELAIHASLTGHIVLSTLHTNDVFGAIPRFIDMHIEPFLLTSTINVVIAQRLVRRVCKYCSKEVIPPEEVLTDVKRTLAELPKEVASQIGQEVWAFKHGEGCARCNFTGFRGRMVIAEAMANTPELQKIIVEGASTVNMQQEFKRQGMVSMLQDGLIKALRGFTTIEEVVSATKS